MKKVILKAVGKIEIVDVQEPELGEGEALIEMKACGLCHGDIAPYEGTNLDSYPLPRVCGHEFGGIILKIKGKTSNFKIGDKVVVYPILSCGDCYYCKLGFDQLCIGSGEDFVIKNFGTQAREGGLAERIAVPISNLIRLPDNFDMELTGIIEPAAVAYNNTKDIKNSNVVVIGSGAIGLIAIKFLKLDKNRVIAVDISENALRLAKKIGADFTINIKDEKKTEKIKEFLNGEFVDYAVLYFIDDNTIAFAVDIIKKCGEIRIVGVPVKSITQTNILLIVRKSLRLNGHAAYSLEDFLKTVNLVIRRGKKLNLKELISARFPLEKAKEAFDTKKRNDVAKVILIN